MLTYKVYQCQSIQYFSKYSGQNSLVRLCEVYVQKITNFLVPYFTLSKMHLCNLAPEHTRKEGAGVGLGGDGGWGMVWRRGFYFGWVGWGVGEGMGKLINILCDV